MPSHKVAPILPLWATSAVLVASIAITSYLRQKKPREATENPDTTNISCLSAESLTLGNKLAAALPDSIILPTDTDAFRQATGSYWAKQESESIPACVFRPRNAQELSTAITILQSEHRRRSAQTVKKSDSPLFAIRGGGHSPATGAASINGGVLIDLSLFQEVTISEDESSVTIGAGMRWGGVSKILDKKGLAVVGGRNCDVGVAGLILGGGISFFTPRFGFVCSNILSFEVVLASGLIVTASASSNPDLWRALKGGANNFGIVTRFTVRAFPCKGIWSGLVFLPSFESDRVLAAFHEICNRVPSSSKHDPYASGPITCFSYIQKIGIQAIGINLTYTKPPETANKWPAYWETSGFKSLWRLWNTCKVRTITSAMEEITVHNPYGHRQAFATTTIKNDPATLAAVHAAYRHAIPSLRQVRGLMWIVGLQPLPAASVEDDSSHPLGLDSSKDGPLVVVVIAATWDDSKDDDLVRAVARNSIQQIDKAAEANKASHRYRYLNYCGEWQRPFESYGEENFQWMQGVSKEYDPEGLFQGACSGGFKLH